MKRIFLTILLATFISACTSVAQEGGSPSELLQGQPQGSDVELDGLWECRDYVYDEKVALTIGKTNITVRDVVSEKLGELRSKHDSTIEELESDELLTESLDKLQEFYAGFIALVGEKKEAAFYHRQGLDHRWEWGDGYVFIIEPSGRGYYYDFTDAAEGESVSASDSFKCERK